MLSLEILTYASVCCGFSRFASLEIPLVIHTPLKEKRLSIMDSRSLFIYISLQTNLDGAVGGQKFVSVAVGQREFYSEAVGGGFPADIHALLAYGD